MTCERENWLQSTSSLSGASGLLAVGGQNTSPSIDREIGFRNALVIHKLRVPDSYVVHNERIEEGGDKIGFQAMRQLLNLRTKPDAVFCYNDLTAIGAIEAVLQAGLRVPEDVAVIGCGNFRYSPYLRIPLSSVDQNTAELGRLAGEMALELSLQSGTVPRSVVLKPCLVVRQSTRRL